MGARKRHGHGGGKGTGDKTDARPRPKKVQQHGSKQAPSSSMKPLLVATCLFMFVGLSAGIYFYNFGDINQVIGELHTRVTSAIQSWSEEQAVPISSQQTDDELNLGSSKKLNDVKDANNNEKISQKVSEEPALDELGDLDGSDVVTPGSVKTDSRPGDSDMTEEENGESLKREERAAPTGTSDKMEMEENVDNLAQEGVPTLKPDVPVEEIVEVQGADEHSADNYVEPIQEEYQDLKSPKDDIEVEEQILDLDVYGTSQEEVIRDEDFETDEEEFETGDEDFEMGDEDFEASDDELDEEVDEDEDDENEANRVLKAVRDDENTDIKLNSDKEGEEAVIEDLKTKEDVNHDVKLETAKEVVKEVDTDIEKEKDNAAREIPTEKEGKESVEGIKEPTSSESVDDADESNIPPKEKFHETVADEPTQSVNEHITETSEKTVDPVIEVSPSKPPYEKADITNDADYEIREELDTADSLVEKERPTDALTKYRAIQEKYPNSPRAQYGVAWSLDVLSELERSNHYLEKCITEYLQVLSLSDVPKELMLKAGKRAADRQSFRGWGGRAIKSIRLLLDFYPEELSLWNELGVQNLMFGRNEDGRRAFQQVLEQDPDNGFAMAHLGFIIKTYDRDAEKSIPYLQAGIDSNEPGTEDGRFYFHLGDALHRLGRGGEAYKLYELGAKKGLFRSAYQRSLYNVDALTGQPWWTAQETGNNKHLQMLQDNWKTIRDEGVAQFDKNTGVFIMEDEDLRDKGDWKQFTLFAQGRKDVKNCAKAPKTCALVEQFTEAAGCKRGQVKFSVMEPGVHVWPHCGPTNCRIRAHLGLVVPDGTSIRVANETRTWHEGKFTIFDDSFEHEVWHNGISFRMVLIVDMWHPELTAYEKRTLSPI